MPIVRVNGVDIYYEDTGRGFPLVWSHEFGGDHRSWEPQVRQFSRRYRVITYNHRGYPPSSVPKEPEAYSQEQLVEDLRQLLRQLGVRLAHVGGCSMGANVALNFGLAHPEMAKSLIVVGCGSGTTDREQFVKAQLARAEELEREGIEALVRNFQTLATRRAFREKDRRGWEEFIGYVREHDAVACAHLMRGVILKRKTIFELEAKLRELRVPTLVMTGDQDEPCIEPSLFMRRHIPHAGLVVVPMTGHTVNIEEPALFNLEVGDFLTAVESGRWGTWTA
jgi:pimeloyl-ACP methyl ester carboxylesterase